MLVEASKVSFASNEQDLCTPKDAVEVDWLWNFFWQNEVDNLNEISLENANVTYFDNDYIACSTCRRKCTGCKVLLLADGERQEQNKEYISIDYMSLFDDTNRRPSAITELCYAVTTLCKLTMLFYQIARFESNLWHLINSNVFLLKRGCVFLLHQLLSLTSIVPKTVKTLHWFSKPLSIA